MSAASPQQQLLLTENKDSRDRDTNVDSYHVTLLLFKEIEQIFVWSFEIMHVMILLVSSKKGSRPYVVFVKRSRKLFFIYFSVVSSL